MYRACCVIGCFALAEILTSVYTAGCPCVGLTNFFFVPLGTQGGQICEIRGPLLKKNYFKMPSMCKQIIQGKAFDVRELRRHLPWFRLASSPKSPGVVFNSRMTYGGHVVVPRARSVVLVVSELALSEISETWLIKLIHFLLVQAHDCALRCSGISRAVTPLSTDGALPPMLISYRIVILKTHSGQSFDPTKKQRLP